eukprot:TRINITY_DN20765_c0_g1_i1.p1 TRINITY_DN20765_c0_g1~~TRINITY_DN20765_c0_g1_i1.p1  ORF type:complete len:301 (-),score=72.43 TRINITY_DN20765_c0_g1_i1:390-1292(-)
MPPPHGAYEEGTDGEEAPGTPPPPGLDNDAPSESVAEGVAFELTIKKTPGSNLGMDVTYCCTREQAKKSRPVILIARIADEGLVAAWNATSQEPRIVKKGDSIYQVNSVSGDTSLMIKEMKEKVELTIHVCRREGANDSEAADAARSVADSGPAEDALAPSSVANEEEEDELDIGSAAAADTAPPPPPAPAGPPPPPPPPPQSSSAEQALPEATVESLLPQLDALSDEALAGLVCVALKFRPWLRAPILAGEEDESAEDRGNRGGGQNGDAALGSPDDPGAAADADKKRAGSKASDASDR